MVAVLEQTSWSAREWMPFALQRLSVQLWIALADEAQRAIGAASRGREGPRGDAMPSLAYVHSNSRPISENRVKSQTAPTQTAHMNAKAKTRPYHFRHSILFKLRTD